MSDSDLMRFVIENGAVTAAYDSDGDFEGPDYEHAYQLEGSRVIEQEIQAAGGYEIKYYDPTSTTGIYVEVESFYSNTPVIDTAGSSNLDDSPSDDNSSDDSSSDDSQDDSDLMRFVIENGVVTAAYEIKGEFEEFEGPDHEHTYEIIDGQVVEREYKPAGGYELNYYTATDTAGIYVEVASEYVNQDGIIALDDSLFSDDHYHGSSDDDEYHGHGGNDHLYGKSGNDDLYGDDGDDYLSGGDLDDYLDGGNGLDFALFAGRSEHYRIEIRDDGSIEVEDESDSGSDGLDTLVNIERLQFEDSIRAFDIEGNAGTALRFIATIASDFIDSPEIIGTVLGLVDDSKDLDELFTDYLPLVHILAGSESNQDVARLALLNVLNSDDPDTVSFLSSFMEGPNALTQSAFLTAVAGLDVNVNIDWSQLQATGIEYTPVVM